MKYIFSAMAIASLLVFSASDSSVAGEMKYIKPVKIVFNPISIVFVSTENAHTAVEAAKEMYPGGEEYVLDAMYRDKQETLWWCKRTGENSFKDIFNVREIPLTELKKLKNASDSVLHQFLGEPIGGDGPLDSIGTYITIWRTCNGKNGDRFLGVEAVAGFRADTGTNALFLLISIAHGTNATVKGVPIKGFDQDKKFPVTGGNQEMGQSRVVTQKPSSDEGNVRKADRRYTK